MAFLNKRSISFELADEADLVRSAKGGDLDAFNSLILRHQSFLFGIALRILNNEDTAADAVQDALLSAFRKFYTFRGGSLRSWLARIVVNACYDELRRKHRQPIVPLDQLNQNSEEMEPGRWWVDSSAGPEERCEASELQHTLERCLQSLTPAYRVALVLVDVEGLPYEEAARVMRVPIGTVKSRLARARMQLRQHLKQFKEILPPPYQINFPIAVGM